jgi:hypothetical protein
MGYIAVIPILIASKMLNCHLLIAANPVEFRLAVKGRRTSGSGAEGVISQ